jgi:hypothetical protein
MILRKYAFFKMGFNMILHYVAWKIRLMISKLAFVYQLEMLSKKGTIFGTYATYDLNCSIDSSDT